MENGVFVVNIAVVAAQHLLLATVAVAAAVAAVVVADAAAVVAGLVLTLCSLSVDMSSCRAMSFNVAFVFVVAVAVVRARSYVVYSLTVALSLRQSPHINKQIALNGLCNESCLSPACPPCHQHYHHHHRRTFCTDCSCGAQS